MFKGQKGKSLQVSSIGEYSLKNCSTQTVNTPDKHGPCEMTEKETGRGGELMMKAEDEDTAVG